MNLSEDKSSLNLFENAVGGMPGPVPTSKQPTKALQIPVTDDVSLRDYTVEEVLKWVTADTAVEAQWLNHLSQLEYVGARKILKAVAFEDVDLLTLQHVHEESGHAYMLKQLACDLDPKTPNWSGSRFCAIGWKYFSELDAEVSALLDDRQVLAYPLVSFIVEERVMLLYPAYRRLTQRTAVKSVLKIILAQEGRHEVRFERWVDSAVADDLIGKARAIENRKWNRFAANIEQVCNKH